MSRVNPERWNEHEFEAQHLSDYYDIPKEIAFRIVQFVHHRLGQIKDESGSEKVLKIISYAPDHKIAKGSWSYLSK